jgi:hypothetical protein
MRILSSPRTTRPPPPASSTLVVRLESPPHRPGTLASRHPISLPPFPSSSASGEEERKETKGGAPGRRTTRRRRHTILPSSCTRPESSSLLLGLGSNSGCHNTTSAGGHRQPCRPSTSLAVLPRSVPSVWFGSVLGFHSCFRSGLC